MVYPKNNFATDAKYWAREVEKKVTNLENSLQSSDINNTTRDSQLSVAAGQALITANAAKDAAEAAATASSEADEANQKALEALQEIIDLSGPDGPSINANNINGGTITGITVQTSAIGERVVLSGDEIDFYNNAGQLSGTIQGQYNNQDAMTIRNPGGGHIYMEASAGVLMNGGFTGFGDSGVEGNFSASSFSGTNNSSIANNTTSSFAANVFINTSGNMFRSTQTSSRDAKENISPIEFDTDAFISVNPVEFNYKAKAVSTAEEAALPQLGFILEDFEDAGVSEHLIIPTNELDDYKGLRYDKLYMYLHKVVQTQNATIKTLETRLDALEAR